MSRIRTVAEIVDRTLRLDSTTEPHPHPLTIYRAARCAVLAGDCAGPTVQGRHAAITEALAGQLPLVSHRRLQNVSAQLTMGWGYLEEVVS